MLAAAELRFFGFGRRVQAFDVFFGVSILTCPNEWVLSASAAARQFFGEEVDDGDQGVVGGPGQQFGSVPFWLSGPPVGARASCRRTFTSRPGMTNSALP